MLGFSVHSHMLLGSCLWAFRKKEQERHLVGQTVLPQERRGTAFSWENLFGRKKEQERGIQLKISV
ncbi:MAG: hypothetical protein GY696_00600 [Gammaproteobacteria bacterium]|nr:hypothetical protein [Gammaproteobacteria bacterium]